VLPCAKGCGEGTELVVYKDICSDISIIYKCEYEVNHYNTMFRACPLSSLIVFRKLHLICNWSV